MQILNSFESFFINVERAHGNKSKIVFFKRKLILKKRILDFYVKINYYNKMKQFATVRMKFVYAYLFSLLWVLN